MQTQDSVLISVVICSYSPVKDIFSQVLEGLKCQHLDKTLWELIIVDNASEIPVKTIFDISWHSRARIVEELRQGLIHARFKGISEAKGSWIVFVDDDNILDKEYLHQVVQIIRRHPQLGVFGGQVLPAYKTEPKPWIKPYESYLALKQLTSDNWGKNLRSDHFPVGAGMVIKKSSALLFCQKMQNDSRYTMLGRKKNELQSGEDIEMVFSVLDEGLEGGVFKDLKLTHVIPSFRVEEKYILKLAEGITASANWQLYLRKGPDAVFHRPSCRPVLKSFLYLLAARKYGLHTFKFECRRFLAVKRGIVKSNAWIKDDLTK